MTDWERGPHCHAVVMVVGCEGGAALWAGKRTDGWAGELEFERWALGAGLDGGC